MERWTGDLDWWITGLLDCWIEAARSLSACGCRRSARIVLVRVWFCIHTVLWFLAPNLPSPVGHPLSMEKFRCIGLLERIDWVNGLSGERGIGGGLLALLFVAGEWPARLRTGGPAQAFSRLLQARLAATRVHWRPAPPPPCFGAAKENELTACQESGRILVGCVLFPPARWIVRGRCRLEIVVAASPSRKVIT